MTSLKLKVEAPDIFPVKSEVKKEPSDGSINKRLKRCAPAKVKNELDEDFSHDVERGVANLTEVLIKTLLPTSSQVTDVSSTGSIPNLSKVKHEKETDATDLKGDVVDSKNIKVQHCHSEKVPRIDANGSIKQENVKQETRIDHQEEDSTVTQSFMRTSVIQLLNQWGYADKATDANIKHIVGWLMNGRLPTEAELNSLFNPPTDGDQTSNTPHHQNPPDINGENDVSKRDCEEEEEESRGCDGEEEKELSTNHISPLGCHNSCSEIQSHGRKTRALSKQQTLEAKSSSISQSDSLSSVESDPTSGPDCETSNTPHHQNPPDSNGENDVGKRDGDGEEEEEYRECDGEEEKELSTNHISPLGCHKSCSQIQSQGRKTRALSKQQTLEAKTKNSSISQSDSLSSVESDPTSGPDCETPPSPPRYSLRRKPRKSLVEERLTPTEDFCSDSSDEWIPGQTRKDGSEQTSNTPHHQNLPDSNGENDVSKRDGDGEEVEEYRECDGGEEKELSTNHISPLGCHNSCSEIQSQGRKTRALSKQQTLEAKTKSSSISQSDSLSSFESDPTSGPDCETPPSSPRYSLRRKPRKSLVEERLTPTEDFCSDSSDEWIPGQTGKDGSEPSLRTLRKRTYLRGTNGMFSKMKEMACNTRNPKVDERTQGNKRKREDNMKSEKCKKKNAIVTMDKSLCDKVLQKEKSLSLTKLSDKQAKEAEKGLETVNMNGKGVVCKESLFATVKTSATAVDTKKFRSPTTTDVTTEIQTTTNVKGDEVITSITKTEIKTVTRTEIIKKLPLTDKTAAQHKAVKSPSTRTVSSTFTTSKTQITEPNRLDKDADACTKCVLAFTSKSLLQRHMFRLHYDEYLRLRKENFWE